MDTTCCFNAPHSWGEPSVLQREGLNLWVLKLVLMCNQWFSNLKEFHECRLEVSDLLLIPKIVTRNEILLQLDLLYMPSKLEFSYSTCLVTFHAVCGTRYADVFCFHQRSRAAAGSLLARLIMQSKKILRGQMVSWIAMILLSNCSELTAVHLVFIISFVCILSWSECRLWKDCFL